MAIDSRQTSRDEPAAAPKKFSLAVKVFGVLLPLIVVLILAEAVSRVIYPVVLSEPVPGASTISAPLYTAEELRRDLPRFSERGGRNCITLRTDRLYWDPRFGFARKKLDKDCAKKLFAAHKTSVVLMGGSAMEDFQAPNYLTSIDTYAFGDDPSIASLNLAESGARHSNMLIRFIHEVIELHPTYVVFLDGVNEFNSIRMGGAPEDDFYWTAGVKDRIANPLRFYFDKMVEQSGLLRLIAVGTGLINPARISRSRVDEHTIELAADYYVKMRGYTEALCKVYNIKCVFIIQPIALLEKNPSGSTKHAVEEHLRYFRSDAEVYNKGYEYIFKKAGDKVLDASHLFEGKSGIFIDFVHFNKRGSKLMGDYIRAALHLGSK
jgi:hypothetical protein